MPATAQQVADAALAGIRIELTQAAEKIRHCVGQLSDDDIWFRPHESMNAIGNILLHVCGNLRQWIVAGVGGAEFKRDRPAEFAERRRIPRDELMARFDQTIADVDATLAAVDAENLVRIRHVQHAEQSGAAAAAHSVSHLVGHMQEIIYITRLRLGEGYRFRGITAKSH